MEEMEPDRFQLPKDDASEEYVDDFGSIETTGAHFPVYSIFMDTTATGIQMERKHTTLDNSNAVLNAGSASLERCLSNSSDCPTVQQYTDDEFGRVLGQKVKETLLSGGSHFPGFEDVFMQDALSGMVLDKGFNQEVITEYHKGVTVPGNEQLDSGSIPVKGIELKTISDSDTIDNSESLLHEYTGKIESILDHIDGQRGSVSRESDAVDVSESNKKNISEDDNQYEASNVAIEDIEDGILHDDKFHHDKCAEEQGEEGVVPIAFESSSLENVLNAEVIPVHTSVAVGSNIYQHMKVEKFSNPGKHSLAALSECQVELSSHYQHVVSGTLDIRICHNGSALNTAPILDTCALNAAPIPDSCALSICKQPSGLGKDAPYDEELAQEKQKSRGRSSMTLELIEAVQVERGRFSIDQQIQVPIKSPDVISQEVDKVDEMLERKMREQVVTRSREPQSSPYIKQAEGGVEASNSSEGMSIDALGIDKKLELTEREKDVNECFYSEQQTRVLGRSPDLISGADKAHSESENMVGEQAPMRAAALDSILILEHLEGKNDVQERVSDAEISGDLDVKGAFSGEEKIQVPDKSVHMISLRADGTNVKLQEMMRKQDTMRPSLLFEGKKGVKDNLSEQVILSASGPGVSQLTLLNYDGVEVRPGFEKCHVSEVAGVTEAKQMPHVVESSTSFITVDASSLCNTPFRASNSASILDSHGVLTSKEPSRLFACEKAKSQEESEVQGCYNSTVVDDLTIKEKLELVGGQDGVKDGSSGKDQLEPPAISPSLIVEVDRIKVSVGQIATRSRDLRSAAVAEQLDGKRSVGGSVLEEITSVSSVATPLLEFGVCGFSDNAEITRDKHILSVEGDNVLEGIDDVNQWADEEEERLLNDGQLGDEKQRAETKKEEWLGIEDEKQASVEDEGSLLKNGSFSVVTADEVKKLKKVMIADPGQIYEAEGQTLSNNLAVGDFKHLQFIEVAVSSGNTIAGHSCDTEINRESYARQGPHFEEDTYSTHARHENKVLDDMGPSEGVEGSLMQDVAVGGFDAHVEVPVFNKMEESANLFHFARNNDAKCNCEQDHFTGHVLTGVVESSHALCAENVKIFAAKEVASGKEVSDIADFCTKESEGVFAMTCVGDSSWTKEETLHLSNAKGFKASKVVKHDYACSLALSGKDGNSVLQEKQHCIEGITKVEKNRVNFNVGDLVWAKVKSHPWWPGMVFSAADASVSAKKLQVTGRILVAFFADRTFAWLTCSQIIPFELNFSMKVKQTNMKIFCSAVAEALDEVCRRTELGTRCYHFHGDLHSKVEFPDTNTGIQKGAQIVRHSDITQSKNNFEPAKMLEFIKAVACTPVSPCSFSPETSKLLGHAYSLQTGMSALKQIQSDELLKNMFINIKKGKLKRKFSYVEASEYMTRTKKICGLRATGSRKYLAAENNKNARKAKTNKDVSGKTAIDAAGDSKTSSSLFKKNNAATSGAKVGRSNLESVSLKRGLADNEYEVKKRLKTCRMPSTGTKHPKVKGEEDKHVDDDSETLIALAAGSKLLKIIKEGKLQNVKLQKSGFNAKAEVKDLNFAFDDNACLQGSKSHGEESQQYKLDGDKLSARPVEETKKESSLQSVVRRPAKGDKLGGQIAKKSSEEASPRKGASVISFKDGLQKPKVPVGSGLMTKKSLDGIPDITITGLFQHFLFLARNPHSSADSKGSLAATRAAFIKLRERTFLDYDTTWPLVDSAIEGTHFVSEEKRQPIESGSVGVDQQAGACNVMVKKPSSQFFSTKAKANKQKLTELEMSSRVDDITLSTERHRNIKPEMTMHRFVGGRNHPRIGNETGTKSWKKATDVVEKQDMDRKKGCEMAQAPFNRKRGIEDKASLGPPFGLFMKFPRNITLPSEAQLKATFVRFGPLESSQTRVFKNTASAVVVFKHCRDAKAALKHAKEKKIFGKDAFVAYRVREFLKRPDLKQDPSQTVKGKFPSRVERGGTAQQSEEMCIQGEAKEDQGRSSSSMASRGLDKESNRTLDSNSRPAILEPSGDIQDKMMKLLQQVGVMFGGSSSSVADHTPAWTPKG